MSEYTLNPSSTSVFPSVCDSPKRKSAPSTTTKRSQAVPQGHSFSSATAEQQTTSGFMAISAFQPSDSSQQRRGALRIPCSSPPGGLLPDSTPQAGSSSFCAPAGAGSPTGAKRLHPNNHPERPHFPTLGAAPQLHHTAGARPQGWGTGGASASPSPLTISQKAVSGSKAASSAAAAFAASRPDAHLPMTEFQLWFFMNHSSDSCPSLAGVDLPGLPQVPLGNLVVNSEMRL
jgi:hypothetical protein